MIIRFRIKEPNGATTRWDYIEDADKMSDDQLAKALAQHAWYLIGRDMESGESMEFQKLEITKTYSTSPR